MYNIIVIFMKVKSNDILCLHFNGMGNMITIQGFETDQFLAITKFQPILF